MGVRLFFIVITTFVNAQFIAFSEFLDACEVEKFWLPSATLQLHAWAHHWSMGVFLEIWKWCQVRRIWWMKHLLKSRFSLSSMSSMDRVFQPLMSCILCIDKGGDYVKNSPERELRSSPDLDPDFGWPCKSLWMSHRPLTSYQVSLRLDEVDFLANFEVTWLNN